MHVGDGSQRSQEFVKNLKLHLLLQLFLLLLFLLMHIGMQREREREEYTNKNEKTEEMKEEEEALLSSQNLKQANTPGRTETIMRGKKMEKEKSRKWRRR